MARDVKEKKCGCVVFDYGPPILCDKHQAKATRKADREQKREEKGLRKVVSQQAFENGHDLSTFREYSSQRGKWTAHCHACGSIAIVYTEIPEYGDQVNAAALLRPCQKSTLVAALDELKETDGEEKTSVVEP